MQISNHYVKQLRLIWKKKEKKSRVQRTGKFKLEGPVGVQLPAWTKLSHEDHPGCSGKNPFQSEKNSCAYCLMSSCPALLGNAWLQPPSISMVLCWTCLINVFFYLGDTKLKSKHGLMSVEQRESIISFSLCVVLLLTPRRMPFAFFPPRHTGLTCDFRSAAALGTCSAELLPCQYIPSLHHSQPFCLPRDMTSQLSLLNFIGLLLARSSLSSSNWISALLLSILTDIPSSVSSAHVMVNHLWLWWTVCSSTSLIKK